MRIEFDEDKHEYTVNGVKVPSVSEILAPLSADRYSQVNPWVLQAAAERGRAVHEAAQLMDYGFDPEEDFSVNGYLIAYQDFLSSTNVEWIYAEKIVGADRYLQDGTHSVLYAGTLDRYGYINGQAAVVDIKTYASLSTDSLLQASCQTALYREALLENIPEDEAPDDYFVKRYVLHLKKDGSWRLVDLDKFDSDHGFPGASVAMDLMNLWWTLYNAKQAKKKGKKNVDSGK